MVKSKKPAVPIPETGEPEKKDQKEDKHKPSKSHSKHSAAKNQEDVPSSRENSARDKPSSAGGKKNSGRDAQVKDSARSASSANQSNTQSDDDDAIQYLEEDPPNHVELSNPGIADIDGRKEKKKKDKRKKDTNFEDFPEHKSQNTHVSPEKAALLQSVHAVEERLKTRVQYQVEVHKIEVSQLIAAHKLLKNQPWIRAVYGASLASSTAPGGQPSTSSLNSSMPPTITTWTLPSPQKLREEGRSDVQSACAKDGSAAYWQHTQQPWTFLLERNEGDRQDFVLAVCSRDVVLGRYVLQRGELSALVHTQQEAAAADSDAKSHSSTAGYFSVEGELRNDLGRAGRVTLLCRCRSVRAAEAEEEELQLRRQREEMQRMEVQERSGRSRAQSLLSEVTFEQSEDKPHRKKLKQQPKTQKTAGAKEKGKKKDKHAAEDEGEDGPAREAEDEEVDEEEKADHAQAEEEEEGEEDKEENEAQVGNATEYLGAIQEDNVEETEPAPVQTSQLVYTPAAQSSLSQPRAFVALRILGIAVMDLASAHLFEANSPQLQLQAGDSWSVLSEPRRHAGPAAKWTHLTWRCRVSRDTGMILTVVSQDKVIGRALLTTDELLQASALSNTPSHSSGPAGGAVGGTGQNNIVLRQMIKSLSNGRDYTGRVKLNLVVDHADDVVEGLQLEERRAQHQRLHSASAASSRLPLLQSAQPLHVNGAVEGAQQWAGPCNVVVHEAFALDVSLPAYLRLLHPLDGGAVSLTLHCAAGSWAQSSQGLKSDGRLCHWLGLGWIAPLHTPSCALRVTLWAGDLTLGAVSLSASQLRADLEAGTGDVLTQLVDARNRTVGKLKLRCRFDALPYYPPATSATSSPEKYNPLQQSTDAADNVAPQNPQRTQKPQTPQIVSLPPDTQMLDVSASYSLPPTKNPFIVEQYLRPLTAFPLIALVTELVLVDLLQPSSSSGMLPMLPSFLTAFSGPVAQLACDRLAFSTLQLEASNNSSNKINSSSGRQSMRPSSASHSDVRWSDLQWLLRVRADSSLVLRVVSRKGVLLGSANIEPSQLLHLPCGVEGISQVSLPLLKDQQLAGRAVLKMRLKPDYNHPDYEPSADDVPLDALSLNRDDQLQLQQRALQALDTLAQSAKDIPQMPWNTSSADPQSQHAVSDPYALPADVSSHQNTSTSNGSRRKGAKEDVVIFDPRLVLDLEEAQRRDLQCVLCIDDLDLWDLAGLQNGLLRWQSSDMPRVSAACGRWTATTLQPPQRSSTSNPSSTRMQLAGASKRSFWSQLRWRCVLHEPQQQLRLTVSSTSAQASSSSSKVLGAVSISVQDLCDIVADDSGVRRLTAALLPAVNNASSHPPQSCGNVQISYHLEIRRTPLPTPSHPHNALDALSHASTYLATQSQSNKPRRSLKQSEQHLELGLEPSVTLTQHPLAGGASVSSKQMARRGSVQSHHRTLLDSAQRTATDFQSLYDTLDDDEREDLDAPPSFPCSLVLQDVAVLELLPLPPLLGSSFLLPWTALTPKKKRNGATGGSAEGMRIAVEAYAENFFQTTQLDRGSTDFHSFLSLQWPIALQQPHSLVRLVVKDAHRRVLGTCDLRPLPFWTVPPDERGLREVMLGLERDGLNSGKLIVRARFQSLANPTADPTLSLLLQQQQQQDMSSSVYSHPSAHPSAAPYANNQINSNYYNNNNNQTYANYNANANAAYGNMLQPASHLERSVDDTFLLENNFHGNANVNVNAGGGNDARLIQQLTQTNTSYNSRRSSTASAPPPRPSNISLNTRDVLAQGILPIGQRAPSPVSFLDPALDPNHIIYYDDSNNNANNNTFNRRRASSAADSALSLPSTFNNVQTPSSAHLNGSLLQGPLPAGSSTAHLGPLQVVIRAVAIIDLPSVHRLQKNLPAFSLACGRFSYASASSSSSPTNKTKAGAGAVGAVDADGHSATWEPLQIAFVFDEGSQLRLLVTSRSVTIGGCSLSRLRLLNGRRSAQSGSFVVVDELLRTTGTPVNATSPSSSSAVIASATAVGKVKIIYDLVLAPASPHHTNTNTNTNTNSVNNNSSSLVQTPHQPTRHSQSTPSNYNHNNNNNNHYYSAAAPQPQPQTQTQDAFQPIHSTDSSYSQRNAAPMHAPTHSTMNMHMHMNTNNTMSYSTNTYSTSNTAQLQGGDHNYNNAFNDLPRYHDTSLTHSSVEQLLPSGTAQFAQR